MLEMQEPFIAARDEPNRFALFNLGFRPFYLLASVFAALSVVLWICQYAGYLPVSYMRSPAWHGHEMLFGFAMAVIAGFLFTAVQNWSGQPTPKGLPLALYATLWITGRILVLTPWVMASALINAAFPLAIAVAIGIPLIRGGNKRNYFFIALMIVLGLATLAMHLSHMDVLAWPERISMQTGLDLVLFIIAVIAGRVLPMFTNNGIPGAGAERNPVVEKLALGGVLALLVAGLLQASPAAIAVLSLAVALAHGARLFLWKTWRTFAMPLVWILHAAYGWIVIYLLLRTLEGFGLVSHAIVLHALTLGTIGGMTIGMMVRTARGHTGRPLKADKADVVCFILIQCAALIRVFGCLLFPQIYIATVIVSGLCWSAAFALYAIRYAPKLCRPRVDGKPG